MSDTVVINRIDGTSVWTWVRHFEVIALKPSTDDEPDSVDDATGEVVNQTVDEVHAISSNLTFADQFDALGHAKAVNADLTSEAFTVVS